MQKKTVSKKEGVYSYVINNESKEDGKFKIPVIDVRDGEAARKKISEIRKAVNKQTGSKFMKESFSMLGRSYREHYPKDSLV